MAELRSVDPRSLVPNPDNPRRTPTPKAMDEQLTASIKAIGLIQPPRVKDVDGTLFIVVGNRRTKAAITAGLDTIDVLVCDADEAADAMRSVSENLIRVSMTSVDIWRATEALQGQGWSEQAIADALALPVRTIKRLKLLAHLHPAMLDFMASGSTPNEEQLRTIAAASREEQAQVWKKHKPKKGQDIYWHEIARALSKRRMPFIAAKFDDELAHAYGVTWHDDLFAPSDEDGRYTTDIDGFFGAQQEWLQNNLPERSTLLPQDEYGRPTLPKKAEHVYGKPGKADVTGYYLDPHSGDVKNVTYRMPEPKQPAKPGRGGQAPGSTGDAQPKAGRPDVTQKGQAIIGDLRTDALHMALKDADIDETRLVALLVLALAGKNVSVQSGAGLGGFEREAIGQSLTADGLLTADPTTIHAAARSMLALVLSCRDNMTSSGPLARVAGEAIGALLHLPNMAAEAFLSCLSKAAIERAAAQEGVRVEARGKDTRAALIGRFKDGLYVYPAARFVLSEQELRDTKEATPRRYVPGTGWTSDHDRNGGEESGPDDADPDETGAEEGDEATDAGEGPPADHRSGDASIRHGSGNVADQVDAAAD